MMQRNASSLLRMAINLGIALPHDYGRAPWNEGLYSILSLKSCWAMCPMRRRACRGGIPVQESGLRNRGYGADKFGFKGLSAVRWNLTAPALYEHAITANEATIVASGALCAETGH